MFNRSAALGTCSPREALEQARLRRPFFNLPNAAPKDCLQLVPITSSRTIGDVDKSLNKARTGWTPLNADVSWSRKHEEFMFR